MQGGELNCAETSGAPTCPPTAGSHAGSQAVLQERHLSSWSAARTSSASAVSQRATPAAPAPAPPASCRPVTRVRFALHATLRDVRSLVRNVASTAFSWTCKADTRRAGTAAAREGHLQVCAHCLGIARAGAAVAHAAAINPAAASAAAAADPGLRACGASLRRRGRARRWGSGAADSSRMPVCAGRARQLPQGSALRVR
jgi:hypothetical protein